LIVLDTDLDVIVPDVDITGVIGRAAGIAIALAIVVMVVAAIVIIAVIALVLRKKKILYFVKPKSTLTRNGDITESTAGKLHAIGYA
jgi:uncharacterized membrane protein (Fun14 family)